MMPPSASSRSTSTSDAVGVNSANIGEPCVVRTPATLVKSLIGTGNARKTTSRTAGQLHQCVGVDPGAIEAERRQRVNERVHGGNPRFEGVDKIVWCYFAAAESLNEACRRKADQFVIVVQLLLSDGMYLTPLGCRVLKPFLSWRSNKPGEYRKVSKSCISLLVAQIRSQCGQSRSKQ
jgi:hypothetical protein